MLAEVRLLAAEGKRQVTAWRSPSPLPALERWEPICLVDDQFLPSCNWGVPTTSCDEWHREKNMVLCNGALMSREGEEASRSTF